MDNLIKNLNVTSDSEDDVAAAEVNPFAKTEMYLEKARGALEKLEICKQEKESLKSTLAFYQDKETEMKKKLKKVYKASRTEAELLETEVELKTAFAKELRKEAEEAWSTFALDEVKSDEEGTSKN